MGLFSAIAKLFRAIIKAIVNFVKKYWKIILMIVLIVVAIYFAPAIAGWLTSVNAPSFLVTGMQWVGANITPMLTSGWAGVTELAGQAWNAFSAASIGTKAAIVTGLSAAIAPEETAEVLKEAGALTGGLITGLASGLLSSPVGLVIAGVCAWLLFRGKSKDNDKQGKEVRNGEDAYQAV